MMIICVMGTCFVGYWDHMHGYSVVEVGRCKTALSWVVIGYSGECGYS